jgi:myo-inositol catabolism protein IolC
MTVGFDQPLYVLPFDQRGTFQTRMFGWEGLLNARQAAEVSAVKEIVYDGFKSAVEGGVPRRKAGLLVDEQFGAGILRDAASRGYTTACPAEKSCRHGFDFEYGEDFVRHIYTFRPTFCKVVVRYNPDGDCAANRRQTARLKRLSDHLHSRAAPATDVYSLFMLELLVRPIPEQLARVGGDRRAFDVLLRPRLTERSIREIHESGVEPDVWTIEGLEHHKDYRRVVAAAREGRRDAVGCIVLGRGADDAGVRRRLTTAAAVPGFIGFSVGGTTYWDALTKWRAGLCSREDAVAEIGRLYRKWVDIFEKARPRELRPDGMGSPVRVRASTRD